MDNHVTVNIKMCPPSTYKKREFADINELMDEIISIEGMPVMKYLDYIHIAYRMGKNGKVVLSRMPED